MTLIDYQMLQPAHPAKDIWYFLYTCTDWHWRQQHLDDCLHAYFDVYEAYLKKLTGIIGTMDFEEFNKEVQDRRGYGIATSIVILPIILNPEPNTFRTMRETKIFLKWRDETFAQPVKEDDAELIVEIKRRYIENVEEGYALGLFQ